MTDIMPVEPAIVDRPAQPYLAVTGRVAMTSISEIADRIPELFGWLAAHGIPPAGAPFLKYNVIDMARELEIEAGVPVNGTVAGDGTVFTGTLPAGRYVTVTHTYVTVTHTGPPDRLVHVTAALLAWARQRGLQWDAASTGDGERWGCRLEIYHTNPAEVPDPNRWETELAFRLLDE